MVQARTASREVATCILHVWHYTALGQLNILTIQLQHHFGPLYQGVTGHTSAHGARQSATAGSQVSHEGPEAAGLGPIYFGRG